MTDIDSEQRRMARRKQWLGGMILLLLLGGGGYFVFFTARTPEQLVQEGKAALTRKDWPTATQRAEQAVRQDPEFVAGWKLLAEAAAKGGDSDRAATALEQYARFETQLAAKLGLQWGTQWMTANRITPAIRALRVAEQGLPEAAEPFRMQAQIAAVTGHPREVVRCLISLIQLKSYTPNDLIVVTSLNPLISDPERVELIRQQEPDNKTLLINDVYTALDQNQKDRAITLLREIVAAHPDDLEAHGILGEILADVPAEDFLAWNRELPEIAAQDARVWLARGQWLQQQGQVSSAIRCLHESFLREPERLTTNILLGQLLLSAGEAPLAGEFTARSQQLQRILDLNTRLKDPRSIEWVPPLIEDLEATGRLWEAWGWSVALEQSAPLRKQEYTEQKQRLAKLLEPGLPRTNPRSLPGQNFHWARFDLPDWSKLVPRGKSLQPPASPQDHRRIQFADVGPTTGLDFHFINSYRPEVGRRIFETMGAGVAVIDYDRDHWPDLYFPQGNSSPRETGSGPSDRLYRNLQGEHFEDVTDAASLAEFAYSQGVAAGDFDNDGFPDVYVANLGRNRLFRNNGDGTFSDFTDAAGLTQELWTVSCAIADLNQDGLPDLIDVNYLQGPDFYDRVCRDATQRPVVCRPNLYDAAPDAVFLNQGDGRFELCGDDCGLDLPEGRGLGLSIADFNDDDRLDLFIANDMTPNFLLINQAGSRESPQFRDEAFLRGVAVDGTGLAQACMGVANADLNRDGAPDLFVTNFAQESNTLYLSQPGGSFADQTRLAGLRDPSFDPLGFGTQFLDADRDGWHDLAVLNGHIDRFDGQEFQMKPQFFRGQSDGSFSEVPGTVVGPEFDQLRLGRGLAVLDWNRDGRTDFVATDLERSTWLSENRTENRFRSLRLQLVGTSGSRDAVGAKVLLTLKNGEPRFAQVTAGDGYEASNERWLEFGLAEETAVQRLEIRWPGGLVQHWESVSAESAWLSIEGHSSLFSLER